MKFLMVENRRNEAIAISLTSAARAGVDLEVLDSVEAGLDFEEFAKRYVHWSSNTPGFELLCFRRYFLLENFLRSRPDVDEFMLVDSDVVFFPGINDHCRPYAGRGFVGSYVRGSSERFKRISPHLSYWSRPALFGFVDFLRRAYVDAQILEQIRLAHREYLERGGLGGVTDMTLLYLWAVQNHGLKGSTTEVSHGLVADHNVNDADNGVADEFCTLFGAKRLVLRNDGVYGKLKSGQRVKFVLLHFQGKSKMFMKYCNGSGRLIFGVGFYLYALLRMLRNRVKQA